MAPLRISHGKPYEEPERHDQLSDGVPEQVQAGDERRPNGTFQQGSKRAQSKGGKSHKGEPALAHKITAPETLDVRHRKAAATLRVALRAEIAKTVGAGICGVAGSLLIKFVAQKTAAAEQAYQRGDYETHRKLSESARMDLVYARDLEAKAAQSRPKGPRVDPAERYREGVRKRLAEREEQKRLAEASEKEPKP
jgi:hypothetical protein